MQEGDSKRDLEAEGGGHLVRNQIEAPSPPDPVHGAAGSVPPLRMALPRAYSARRTISCASCWISLDSPSCLVASAAARVMGFRVRRP